MNIKTKRKVIICIIILLIYFTVNNYTTTLFKANKYNTYKSENITNKDYKHVTKNIIDLMIDNNFNEVYKLLGERTKSTFKSSDELKEYFNKNYSNINKMKDGIIVQEDYSRVDKQYNTYNYIIVSRKYKSPKNYDPLYSESEFNVFDSITIYESSPIDYTIEINL